MRPWTDTDRATLADEWDAGTPAAKIAALLKRDAAEVRSERRAMGLPERSRSDYLTDTWGGQIRPWPKLANDAFR